MPVDKVEGDKVYSGTLNQFGTFFMEVTENGFHTYTLNYEICNVVKKAKDATIMEFEFVDKRNNSYS